MDRVNSLERPRLPTISGGGFSNRLNTLKINKEARANSLT